MRHEYYPAGLDLTLVISDVFKSWGVSPDYGAVSWFSIAADDEDNVFVSGALKNGKEFDIYFGDTNAFSQAYCYL